MAGTSRVTSGVRCHQQHPVTAPAIQHIATPVHDAQMKILTAMLLQVYRRPAHEVCSNAAHLISSSCERCQCVFTDILLSSNGHALADGSWPGLQNWFSCAMTLCKQAAGCSEHQQRAQGG
jgi:hypothetical protein